MTAIPNRDASGPGQTDAELALAAAAGDRRAFAGIYDRYADRLHDFCIGMLRDRDAAADCVHDTFCTAAINLRGLREPEKLRPWLYSIARNEALRRLRERSRERVSDELPDTASNDAGPITVAGRNELADLIADAAAGLSERDRMVLDLTYRHGMGGPELAEALGISQTNAGTMVHRVRDTVERSLGALLVSRRVQQQPARCPQLAATLSGWDGQFTMLMRKRVARHIDSCPACEGERRRLVNPVALLGGAPLFIPAPAWLREQTMRNVELTSTAAAMTTSANPDVDPSRYFERTEVFCTAAPLAEIGVDGSHDSGNVKRRLTLLVALMAGIPLTVLGLALAWMYMPETPIAPIGETETSATPISTPVDPPPTATTTTDLPTTNPTVRPRPSTPARASTTAVPQAPGGIRSTTPPPAPQPSAEAPPTAPLPTPLPTVAEQTPPPGDMQAPPPASAPAPPPATTYVPAPTAPPPAPPAETYKPGPYFEPTFTPPR